MQGFSLVRRLRLCAPSAGDPGLIPAQRTGSHMPQLKILHVTTKMWYSQINKYLKNKLYRQLEKIYTIILLLFFRILIKANWHQ